MTHAICYRLEKRREFVQYEKTEGKIVFGEREKLPGYPTCLNKYKGALLSYLKKLMQNGKVRNKMKLGKIITSV